MSDRAFRQKIILEARRWIGTPYIHQSSVRSHGSDCLGLIRGVWRNCIGEEPEAAPDYSADWGEVSGKEYMLETAHRWFIEKRLEDAQAGDLVLFRWKNASIVKHAGILTTPLNKQARFIHAYERSGVVETSLGKHWKARIAKCFAFPNPEKIRR